MTNIKIDCAIAADEYIAAAQKLFDGCAQVRNSNIFSNNNYILDGFLAKSTSVDTIVINGCGGTGGWFIPKLAKILIDAHMKNKLADQITIYLCDGDNVATKNLIRQNFIMRDVDKNKAEVLANRYSQMFPANVNIVFVDKYIANKTIIDAYPALLQTKFVDIATLPFAEGNMNNMYAKTTLVFNFVDNALSRKCIHNFFNRLLHRSSIVVDTGNNLYNGQLNVSIYDNAQGESPFPSNYFIRNFRELGDTEYVKLENCADADLAVNNPEQMFNVNDFAATVTANMANCLFADSKIYYGLTKFVTGKSLSVENLMPITGFAAKDNNSTTAFANALLRPVFHGGALHDMERTLLPESLCGYGRFQTPMRWDKHYDGMLKNKSLIEWFTNSNITENRQKVRSMSAQYLTELGNFSDFVNAKKLETTPIQAAA